MSKEWFPIFAISAIRGWIPVRKHGRVGIKYACDNILNSDH
jgi:hypothetical protein